MSVKLPSTTQERVKATCEITGDPSAVEPDWAFLAECGIEPADTDYTPGQWAGAYDPATRLIDADSPIIGDTGATVELVPGEYQTWIRVTVEGERMVRLAGVIAIREG